MKYLLSTGEITDRIELYIIDLIKLNFVILPKDIPGSTIGFNYIITNEKKDEMISSIKSKLNSLISKIESRLNKNVNITIQSIDLIDSSNNRIKLVINVNKVQDEIIVSV